MTPSNDNFNAPSVTGARLVPSGRKRLAIELSFSTGQVERVTGFRVRSVALAHMGQLLAEVRKLGRDGRKSVRAELGVAS